MKYNFHIEGGNFTEAGRASSQVKKVLKQLNVDSHITKRVVVALYEAEVNIVAHAYEGNISVWIDEEKIKVLLTDRGPGIADIERAMEEGYSTASPEVREMGFGAGMGLPNIKSNADHLSISSEKDKGTTVEIITYFNEQGKGK